MAVAANAGSDVVSAAVRARQRRQRDEEVLVWPDLVFIEFIAAVLFTITFTILSVLIDGILLDQANPAVTPNPSKAPWYFLNLQELLLHMHPALAGVIVPTVALIALGAIPYFDTSNDYQGQWLKNPGAWPQVIVGATVGTIGTLLLIFYDASKHVQLFEIVTGAEWPERLNWLRTLRSIQTEINWPEGLESIPLGSKVLRTDLLGLPAIDLNVNLPAVLVEQLIPTGCMVGFPLLLAAAVHKAGIAKTRRDHMIVQFSGFIAVYVILTIIGTFFRGEGLELIPYSIYVHEE